MKKILYVNACFKEGSRTNELAQHLLSSLDGQIDSVNLYEENIKPLDAEMLSKRDKLLESGKTDDDFLGLARQFASADIIVIAAPYWDLMFPAVLRTYFEAVCVAGLTFRYSEKGAPVGLCKAKQIYYVTTAGGPIKFNFGYEYVEALAKSFYGIKEVLCVKAEGLDIYGSDTLAILENAKKSFKK